MKTSTILYVLLFFLFTASPASSQSSFYEEKYSRADHMEINKVYRSRLNGKRVTVVVLEFEPRAFRSGILHPPGTEGAYYLTDNNGMKYRLIKQEGWKGTEPNGYGRKSLAKGFSLKLFFEHVDMKKITKFDLIEGNARGGWSFYGIRYAKNKTTEELEKLALSERKRWYYPNGILKALGNTNSTGKKTWRWTEYHKNGKLAGEGKYSHYNGQKINGWKEYYQNGQLKFEGSYKPIISTSDSHKHGYCVSYWPNGQLKEKATYRFGELKGAYSQYYESGKTKELYGTDNTIQSFHSNGNKKLSGQFRKDGKKTGEWLEFYTTGNKKSIENYSHGLKNGEWKTFYPSGKLKSYRKYRGNLLLGQWKIFYEDGTIKTEISYRESSGTPIYKEYNKKGYLVEESVRKLKDGKETVLAKRVYDKFDANGLPGSYKEYEGSDGLTMVIDILSRFENKKLKEVLKTSRRGNKVVRDYIVLFDNGSVSSRASVDEQGKITGEQVYYYKNGQIIQKILMNEGKYMQILECYDLNGKPAKRGTLKNGNGTVLLYNPENGAPNGVWQIVNGVLQETESKK